jgi:hypothetical protein
VSTKDVSKSGKQLCDYLVAIIVGGCLYLYPVVCASHEQAIAIAIAKHEEAGYPLPVGTRIVVKGPCRDADCDCGRLRTKVCFFVDGEAQSRLN